MNVLRTKKVVMNTKTTFSSTNTWLFISIGPTSLSFDESIATKTGTYQSSKVWISKKVNMEKKMLL